MLIQQIPIYRNNYTYSTNLNTPQKPVNFRGIGEDFVQKVNNNEIQNQNEVEVFLKSHSSFGYRKSDACAMLDSLLHAYLDLRRIYNGAEKIIEENRIKDQEMRNEHENTLQKQKEDFEKDKTEYRASLLENFDKRQAEIRQKERDSLDDERRFVREQMERHEKNVRGFEEYKASQLEKLAKREAEIAGIEDSVRKTKTEALREELKQEYKEREASLLQQEQELAERTKKFDKHVAEENGKLNQRVRNLDFLEALKFEQITGKVMALYGLTEHKLKTYEDKGIKTLVVSNMINKYNRNRVDNKLDWRCLDSIVRAMENKDGKISLDMVRLVEKILEGVKSVDSATLIIALMSLKDANGNLDSDKVTYFLSYLPFSNICLADIVEKIDNEYKS